MSIPRHYSHMDTSDHSIRTTYKALYLPKSPKTPGMSLIIYGDNITLIDNVWVAPFLSCTVKFTELQQVLLLPAIPEMLKGSREMTHSVSESFR